MLMLIRYIVWTLVLSCGVFLTMAIPFLPMKNSLLWFAAAVLIGCAAALLAKKCGRGALLLAIPISVLLANAVVVRIWPPQVHHNIFRAFNAVAKHDSAYRQLRKELLPVTRQKLPIPEKLRPGWDAGEQELDVANGIKITLYASGLNHPHNIAVDEHGVVFVSLPEAGQVVSLHDADGDGVADRAIVYVRGLKQPTGLIFKDGVLLVATATRLLALPDVNHDYRADSIRVLTADLPVLKYNRAHALALDRAGRVYISVSGEDGSNSWQQGAVLRVKDGAELQLYASGLYDCQGLALHPRSGSLWCSENGPDSIGYFVHPDELNVLRENGDYGWPFCYGERQPDAKLGSNDICETTIPSLMKLPASSIPRGLAFGYNLHAPEYFRSMLYLVLQGSVSGKQRHGFRLLGVPLDGDGRITGWGIDLVSGWSRDGKAWGQPVDCSVGSDGFLYVTDQLSGAIYRLEFVGADN